MSEYILPLSTSHSVFRALCAVAHLCPSRPDYIPGSRSFLSPPFPGIPSRAPSLPLWQHFLFFWPVSRGCGAALQCCRHGRRAPYPVVRWPLLHRCSCNIDGDGNGRRAHHCSDRQRGNYKVVAATLVHLVVRGRDIGLPRSTLPVRYSFPASLMHYTRLSASACVVVSSLSASFSFFLSQCFYRFCFSSPVFFSFLPFSMYLSALPFQSVFLFAYFPWSISFLPTYPSRDGSFLSPSLFAKTPTRCGSQRIRRIVIIRSHLSCLAPLESRQRWHGQKWR